MDGRPARFVWRERLYTVLSILERPGQDEAPAALRCWKVTASVGRNVPANIYRLCQDVSTRRWLLTRNGG